MKIGIVGGGISGLYLARLLKDKHDVTIFESDKWGGDIQSEHIGKTCYPISTLFAMPGDTLLKREIQRLHIKTRSVHPPGIIYLTPVLLILALLKSVPRKKGVVLILAVSMIVIMKVKSDMCKLILNFGGDENCKSTHKFYTYLGSFQDVLFRSIMYLEDCGASAIAESFLDDAQITYVNQKVIHISRNDSSGCTFTLDDNQTIGFDKCIITIPYNDYKNVIALTDHEISILSGTQYFDFYSTLINTSDSRNVSKSIGHFELGDGVYLFGSHEPVQVKSGTYTFKKSYQWRMPRVYDAAKKQKINDEVTRNVFFAGKELSGNGVNHCMNYSLKLSKLF